MALMALMRRWPTSVRISAVVLISCFAALSTAHGDSDDSGAGDGVEVHGRGGGSQGGERALDESTWHAALTVGGFLGLTGPADYGPVFGLEWFPGWRPTRLGLVARYYGNEGLGPGWGAVGLAYQAGATRPHLSISLHGEIGLSHDPTSPVVGAGVHSLLGIVGPLAISADASAYLFWDGGDGNLRLAFLPALSLSLSR